MSQRERILTSGLKGVFEQHELEEALQKESFDEIVYQPGKRILKKGDHKNSIYFVARGNIIEKDGGLEDAFVPHLRFKRGNFACL